MKLLIGLAFIAFIVYLIFRDRIKTFKPGPFPETWRKILIKYVRFYNELNEQEKAHFEKRVQLFLHTTKITGIKTSIVDQDRLLVASSAIIPVFAFPNWQYINLDEVLIYPTAFHDDFDFNKPGGSILGMVGTGTMEGKMILSKPALIQGFKNNRDKKNVGIHEFTHLIDKSDGVIDGIPSALIDKELALPWLEHVQLKMEEIHELKSDINSYGGVGKEEFFAVITEYFFERPKLLKSKHPELYELLNEIFTVDLSKKYKLTNKSGEIGRNDSCPCGSGEKYKHCCLFK